MKRAVFALATAATIGVTALVTPSPAQAWRAPVTDTTAVRDTATTADRGTSTMVAMPLLITAGTPQRTATATLPDITADTHRAIMLPPMVMGIGALFAPHTRTMAVDTIAGGDRHARRSG